MRWEEVQERFPNEWVVLEATKAHSSEGQRYIEEVVVIDQFDNSIAAMNKYNELHLEEPHRECCFFILPVHHWLGVKDMRVFGDQDENFS